MCDKNLSLMLCEIWGRISNHQVKTDLQLPGLPRPLPSTLLGNQWIPKWVIHDWVWMKRLHEAGVWVQGGEVPSSASHGMRLCHPVSGSDRILLAHASGLSCESAGILPSAPLGILFLGQMVMAKVDSLPPLCWHWTQHIHGMSFISHDNSMS